MYLSPRFPPYRASTASHSDQGVNHNFQKSKVIFHFSNFDFLRDPNFLTNTILSFTLPPPVRYL